MIAASALPQGSGVLELGRFGQLGREGVTGEGQKQNAASEVEVEPGIVDLRGRRPSELVWFDQHRFFHCLAV